MKIKSLITKKEYFGKGSLRELSLEGSWIKEFNPLTLLQLKENECVVLIHPDGRLDQVCRIENHYVANHLREKLLESL